MKHAILCRTTIHRNNHTSYAIDCSCGDWTGFWSQPIYAVWNWEGHVSYMNLKGLAI